MKKITILFTTAIIFTSCVTNKLINKSVKASEINEPMYFEPLSFISLIEKGNKSKQNDSLSNVSKKILDSIIVENKDFKISKKIEISEPKIKVKVDNELSELIIGIVRNNKIEGVKLTPTIDSILKSKKQRFALATVTAGFGRKKGNYGGQIAKGIGVGILTLGMYTPVPVKSNSTLFAVILDSERNEVIYFSKNLPVEKSPTERKVLESQYKKLFNGYFYNVKTNTSN